MKKVVLKLELYDEKGKKKAMMAVSGLEGLDSISMDMKDKKMTVTGDIDPVELAARLSKVCRTEIVSDEPAKEKVVLKLELYGEKGKKKAMRAVSGLEGLDPISRDMMDGKLKVTGDIDPVKLVGRLRKLCRMEIVSVGPAKEEKKKEEPRKEEPKKKDPKDEMTELTRAYQAHYPDPLRELLQAYEAFCPPMPTYYVRSSEVDPNACVIC